MENTIKSVSFKSVQNNNYLSISRNQNTIMANDINLNTLFNLIQISPSNVILQLQDGYYITVDEDNTLKANVLDKTQASVFRLNFINKKEVSLKCDNGHYICVDDDDVLRANEYRRTSKSKFKIKQLVSKPKERQSVTIYADANYQGKSQDLKAGNYNINQLDIGNDQLSSIKVPKGFVVTLYADANFSGKTMTVTQDTPYVGNEFNDMTSSIIVEQTSSDDKVVKIYADANYQGNSQNLEIGSYNINQLTIGNDQLSSIKVPKGFVVTLYSDANFSGKTMPVTQDTPYVGNQFNDTISSIKVEFIGSDDNVVKIYTDANYQGKSQDLKAGNYNISQLNIGNDQLSSIKVPKGFVVTLYADANFTGKTMKVTQDTPYVGNEFNDMTSSIKVEPISSDDNVVKIYVDANYQGKSQDLKVGNYNINQLTIGNDQLSSIKVPKGFVVTLYADANFTGKTMKVTQDTPYVGNEFNDMTSSIKVESISSDNRVVTIYEHANYQGKSQDLKVGSYNTNRLTIVNNTLSSLRVPRGFVVTLYTDDNFKGRTMTVTRDTPYVGDEFNNRTSSIRVRLSNR